MRAARLVIAAVVWSVSGVVGAPPSLAQVVDVSTPYPAVVVEAGDGVVFELDVTGPSGERVDLRVSRKPAAWRTTFRGGGFVIDGVTTRPRNPPDVQLEVDVPPRAREGRYEVVVAASSPSGTDTLELRLRVGRGSAGGVELTAEFPELRGASDATFTFDAQLENNTSRETTFVLEAVGPEAWQVDARPATQEQASTVKVAGGSSSGITVDADPPDDVVAGKYPIRLRATGGGTEAALELTVQITGNFALTLTTPDERLSTDVVAGDTGELVMVVRNEGTAPLTGVELSATPPADWRVEFFPRTIAEIPPGRAVQSRAVITPSGEAVAGDYVVTMSANTAETTGEADVRVTVKTSAAWGVVAVLLILAALVALGWVFRRYGRR